MQKICRTCGLPFSCKPSHAPKKAYCSRACLAQDYATRYQGSQNPHYKPSHERICPHCQTSFHAPRASRIYCTFVCYHAARAAAKHARYQPPPPRQLVFQGFFLSQKRRRKAPICLCQVCHKPFKKYRHRLYCPDCSYIMRPCVICKTLFRTHRADLHFTCSEPCKARYRSVRQQGERAPRWQGGITQEHVLRRTNLVYKTWRTGVFTRDDFTCAMCHKRGGKLAAHHIRRVKDVPERIYDIDNGITLCWPCHHSIHWKEEAYEDVFLALVAQRTA